MRRAKLSLQPGRNSKTFRLLCLPVTCASSDPKGPHLKAVVSHTDGTVERRDFTLGLHRPEVPRLARENTCAALIEPPKPIVEGQRRDRRSMSERIPMPIR
jgi:hypothetical protein